MVALFIVALVATMAYVMMARLERDTRRTSMILRNTQAELLAQGSIAWAMDTLVMNWEKQKPNQLVDVTPMQMPIENIDGFNISATIYDMQGKFNLNSLGSLDAGAGFDKLIREIDPKMPEDEVRQIVRGVSDWLSPADQQNEFSKYYAQLPQPYGAAHRDMLSISELRMVKGMTPALYNALTPYVTALPANAALNIQTASAPVIATLSPSLTLPVAASIVELRAQHPFTSVKVFSDLDIVKNHQIPTSKLTVVSSYFLVETNVAIENQHVLIYTLMERAVKEKNAKINIVWQSKGIW